MGPNRLRQASSRFAGERLGLPGEPDRRRGVQHRLAWRPVGSGFLGRRFPGSGGVRRAQDLADHPGAARGVHSGVLHGACHPGRPGAAAPRSRRQAQVEQVRENMGLDKPVIVQYGIFLADAVRGDLGDSIVTGRPVTTEPSLASRPRSSSRRSPCSSRSWSVCPWA